MAKAHFYMIHIERKKEISFDQVKEKMNLANDWFRIRENLWIVYSTSEPEKWYSRLSEYVLKEGQLFICKLAPEDRQGWMDQGFWDWLNRKKKANK